jgi:phosphate transport system permease protein
MSVITTPEHRGAAVAEGAVLTGEQRLAQMARSKKSRHRREKAIEAVLLLAACVSVFTTVGIVYILLKESLSFFSNVSL